MESTPLTAADLDELREDARTSQYIDSSWVLRLLAERDALVAQLRAWEAGRAEIEAACTTVNQRYFDMQAQLAEARVSLADCSRLYVKSCQDVIEARGIARRSQDFWRHLPDCASKYAHTRVPQPCTCGLERLRSDFDALNWSNPIATENRPDPTSEEE